MKEKASGKKLKGHNRVIPKKVSPKKESRTPELKRLFDKIRTKKENIVKEKDPACEKIMPKKAVKDERKLENLDELCINENDSGSLG